MTAANIDNVLQTCYLFLVLKPYIRMWERGFSAI